MTQVNHPEKQQSSRVRRHVVLATLVCLAVVAWFLATRPPKTPPAEEVTRDMLVLTEGRLYRHGETEPFTGVLADYYPDGGMQSRSTVSNGLFEGVSEGWHTNGQGQVVEHFRGGVSHGLRLKWHENGRLQSEVMVVEGKLSGTFRRWHEDGSLAEEIEMNEGQPDGLSRAYYPSGFLKAEARLRDGKVLEQKFWKDGEHRAPPADANDARPGTVN